MAYIDGREYFKKPTRTDQLSYERSRWVRKRWTPRLCWICDFHQQYIRGTIRVAIQKTSGLAIPPMIMPAKRWN